MCDTCGCGGNDEGYTISTPENQIKNTPSEPETHSHGHEHSHGHGHGQIIAVETDVLSKNNLMAERNRGYFEAKEIKTFNLVSSPGSGKTTILEKLITLLDSKVEISVIEGDQQTINDAQRIKDAGAKAIQINTGNGCHLDAEMIHSAVRQLNPSDKSILFIENVGNLVCPALFDLGESARIVIASTTEGEDKPLKYPNMFQSSQLCIINKTDLLPYLDFDLNRFYEYARQINHHLDFIEISAKSGEGLENLEKWINES